MMMAAMVVMMAVAAERPAEGNHTRSRRTCSRSCLLRSWPRTKPRSSRHRPSRASSCSRDRSDRRPVSGLVDSRM